MKTTIGDNDGVKVHQVEARRRMKSDDNTDVTQTAYYHQMKNTRLKGAREGSKGNI